MSERLVRDETPVEFFREQLERAMEHQRVSTSGFTEFYLVNLLAKCVQGEALPAPEPGFEETPLAVLWVRALQSAQAERVRLLRVLGDTALFVSGFFADSLQGKLVDHAYYRAMGGRAYAHLGRAHDPLGVGRDVFCELSDRFTTFTDLLAEVSEASRLGSNVNVVKLYERWLQTGSRRAAVLLAEKGLTPVRGPEGRVQ